MGQYSFIKMQGIGNDFIVLDERHGPITLSKSQVQHMCDRHKGIGCDQLVIVSESDNASIQVRFYNPDGGQAEACGNATRCVAMVYMDEIEADEATIETLGGILHVTRGQRKNIISVDMGEPRLAWDDIPLAKSCDTLAVNLPDIGDDIAALGPGTAVNMGNPHIVFFVDNIQTCAVEKLGPIIESHSFFPEGVNVNFAEITQDGDINLRIWERGAGETQACGSGACATTVAAIHHKLVDRHCTVKLSGGTLHIDWQEEDNHIIMTGEAAISYTGVISI